jgi:hypothetical protein
MSGAPRDRARRRRAARNVGGRSRPDDPRRARAHHLDRTRGGRAHPAGCLPSRRDRPLRDARARGHARASRFPSAICGSSSRTASRRSATWWAARATSIGATASIAARSLARGSTRSARSTMEKPSMRPGAVAGGDRREAETAVTRNKRAGYSGVKIYDHLSAAGYERIFRAAERLGTHGRRAHPVPRAAPACTEHRSAIDRARLRLHRGAAAADSPLRRGEVEPSRARGMLAEGAVLQGRPTREWTSWSRRRSAPGRGTASRS